ncbi:MAG: prepilin-type N-terminal cleavage/methylation domain-containing protein, partial [Phycisphaerae bacterium]|nr:prepilin-type N-terminal cleavage/methylation domain-containing protein [Phycisphaerae bacterium]
MKPIALEIESVQFEVDSANNPTPAAENQPVVQERVIPLRLAGKHARRVVCAKTRRAGSPPKRNAGFTLVELLVAIGILVILVAMFLAGFKYVRNSSAQSSTHVSLDALGG